jgi:hypothetical protein
VCVLGGGGIRQDQAAALPGHLARVRAHHASYKHAARPLLPPPAHLHRYKWQKDGGLSLVKGNPVKVHLSPST